MDFEPRFQLVLFCRLRIYCPLRGIQIFHPISVVFMSLLIAPPVAFTVKFVAALPWFFMFK